MSDRRLLAAAGLLLAAGVTPFLPILGWIPWGADALKWVWAGSLNADWLTWDFASRHFVGYRPVTALSYTVNHALAGASPWMYRGTDLALHVASAALVGLVWCALAGRSAWALLPMALVLGHPVAAEVVPYAGRRSYLLAAVFGLAAVLATAWVARSRRPALYGGLAGLALALATLSNEHAFVLAPLLPLLVLHDAPERRRLAHLWPALAALIFAISVRIAVLGTFGGYERHYFAQVDAAGVPMWQVLNDWEPRRILDAAVRYLAAPMGPSGQRPLVPANARTAFVVVAAAWWWWLGVVRPVLRWDEPRERLPLGLAAWMLGALGIVVLSQTWFWRLDHGVLVPAALLTTWGMKEAWRSLGEAPRPGPALSLAIGVSIVASMVFRGPILRGLDPVPHEDVIRAEPVADRLAAVLPQVDAPATVWLALPLAPADAQIVHAWSRLVVGRRPVGVRLLATLAPEAKDGGLHVERDPAHPRLVLEYGFQWDDEIAHEGDRLDLSRIPPLKGRPGWVVAMSQDQTWALAIPRAE